MFIHFKYFRGVLYGRVPVYADGWSGDLMWEDGGEVPGDDREVP